MEIKKINNRILDSFPSSPDPRDYHISNLIADKQMFPEEYTYPKLITPLDQKEYGMCVSYSLRAIKNMLGLQNDNPDDDHSSAFIYANRHPENGDYCEEGMYPQQALNNLLKEGTCLYSTFPDRGEYPTLHSKLTDKMKQEALNHKIKSYVRLNTTNDVKNALMNISPISICVEIYPSFYNGGTLSLPNKNKEQSVGFHQMVIVGWKKNNYWLVLNSWGENWSNNGYCLMPFNYPIVEYWAISDVLEPILPPQPVQAFYRVQIFTTRDQNKAKQIANIVSAMTNQLIKIINVSSLYKVQIGQYDNKEQAISLRNFLVNNGYKGSFIVYN